MRRSRRLRRGLAWTVGIAVLLAGLAATFPKGWGPWLVARIIRNSIATPELGGTLEAVEVVSLQRFEMRGLRLCAVPGEPTLDRVSARYTLRGLLRENRLDSLDATGFRMDLGAAMTPEASALFTNYWIEGEAHVASEGDKGRGMTARVDGRLLDWPLRADARFGATLTNGFALAGNGNASLPGTQWGAEADFSATTNGWEVEASLPLTSFDEGNPVIASLLERALPPGVSNLVGQGSVTVDASARMTKAMPVPVWKALVSVRLGEASLVAEETPVYVEGLSVRIVASGIADHWDLAPIMPSFRSARVREFDFGEGRAVVLVDPERILVSEASVGFCGGFVRGYSLFFSPERKDTLMTLFVDGIDAGQALGRLPNFKGTATGRLYGRIPLWVTGEKEVRLRDAFLYSPPGEVGKLCLTDASPITDTLAASGVPEETRDNLSHALSNLDYSVLRLDFRRGDAEESVLSFRVEGTSTEGQITTPVNLTVNFHGALERFLNVGIRAVNGPGKLPDSKSHQPRRKP